MVSGIYMDASFDPALQSSSDFVLSVSAGKNQSASGKGGTPTDFRAAQRTRANEVPVITGQQPDPLTTAEDQAITIPPEALIVTDPDNNYPADFTILVGEGDDYTFSGETITPSANFTGMLSVPVKVYDGESESLPFALQISVTPVNDRPVITGQQPDPITTGQNVPVAIALSNLLVTDPDHTFPADFTLSLLPGENYTASGNILIPSSGFSGMLSANVTVNDPLESSDPYPVNVSVAANTAPVITGQTALSTREEIPLTVTLSDILVSDPDNAYPSGFSLRLLPGDNYTIAGAVISPASDFEGNLSVPVIVNDGTSDSAPFNLQVTVQGVNDAPRITGQVTLSTQEDHAITLTVNHLTVSDPDNAYPGDFTLSVLDGENYSVSGNQVTPASGFNGLLTVRVFVNDGLVNSNFFDVSITVTPLNNAPVITGQRPLEMSKGGSINLTLQDLMVTDPDNAYPQGFSLVVQPGENYTYAATTVTPTPDFTGTLYVNVVVNDGVRNSESFRLQISVILQNDAPVITGQKNLLTNEDVPKEIVLADLLVNDPDNSYPSGFSLLVFPGTNYTLSGNTVTPAENFFGTLTVQVQVNDGLQNSNIFNLSLQVISVNDPPVITGQVQLQTGEDVPVTIQFSDLTVLDVDNTYPAGFSILVLEGTHYTFSGQTITPSTNFNGMLDVNLMVSDGTSNSAPFSFQIQVGNVNDAPVITGQSAVVTDEEKAVTLELSHLTVTDADDVYPTGFTLLVSPGLHYSVSGQTITPAVDFAGTLTIPVRVNDGVNNSATFDFKLLVNQVNDPPGFDAIPNQQVAENASTGSVLISGITKGPMEDDQQLTFVSTSGNTAIIEDPVVQYDGVASTAVLSYKVKPDASGMVTMTLVAIDNGSNTPPNQNSYSFRFQVEVLGVNTSPTLNPIPDIKLLEDAEQQNVTLTGISAGSGEAQDISIVVSTDKPEYFENLEVVYTSPGATGLLQFKTKPDIFGTAHISVTVKDNGQGEGPNKNSVTRTFAVSIQGVSDPPVFTSIPVGVAVINEPYEYAIKVSDPDGEPVTISASEKPSWASLSAAGNGMALLNGKPPADAGGNVSVVLKAKDATTTVEQSFSIFVNVRPELSSLLITTEEDKLVNFTEDFFNGGYTDANGNPFTAFRVMTLPSAGKLFVGEVAVKQGDTLDASTLSALVYAPRKNYFGNDFFEWNASDGYHFSLDTARVDISILSINDPPEILLSRDSLHYEVNGEPDLLSPLIDIVDPDDDSLTQAVVGFHTRNYEPEMDILQFENTGNITGNFDFPSGTLQLTGSASVADYRTALRSIHYLYLNTQDPVLEPKLVYFTVQDGEVEGAPKDRVIMPKYTFIEFVIPSGFTPNGDQVNDTWVIDRPGGTLEDLDRAIVSVYNKQGILVYRAKGFDRPWDGTMDGVLLPADAYFFTIDLQLRSKKTYKGIVTILR